MINNLINGNLKTAREQAKRFSYARIQDYLLEMGWSSIKASAATAYLKHGGQELFQRYCDAD